MPFKKAVFQGNISGIQLRIIVFSDVNHHSAPAFLPCFWKNTQSNMVHW